MTIGLFGDSFGDWENNPEQHFNGFPLKTLSWPYLVAAQTQSKCINTCQGGASLYYSYNQFLKHANQCNTIIFLLTNPGRYTLPMLFKYALPNRIHPNSLHTIEYWLKKKEITDDERDKLLYLKGFYMSLDFEWEHTSCKLLIKEIKRLREDTIFISCFDLYYKDILGDDSVSLESIHRLQFKSLGIKLTDYLEIDSYGEKKVTCHFTPETNKLVADCVIDSIQRKKWTCNLPNYIPHQYDWKEYYNKI